MVRKSIIDSIEIEPYKVVETPKFTTLTITNVKTNKVIFKTSRVLSANAFESIIKLSGIKFAKRINDRCFKFDSPYTINEEGVHLLENINVIDVHKRKMWVSMNFRNPGIEKTYIMCNNKLYISRYNKVEINLYDKTFAYIFNAFNPYLRDEYEINFDRVYSLFSHNFDKDDLKIYYDELIDKTIKQF